MRGTASTHQRRGGKTPEWLVEGTGEGILIGDPGNKATSTLGTVSLMLGVGGPDEDGGVERVAHGPGKTGRIFIFVHLCLERYLACKRCLYYYTSEIGI